MAWGINAVGKRENILQALELQGAKMTGADKDEFTLALPHLIGLVETFSARDLTHPVVTLVANNSSCTVDGKPSSHHFNVSIKRDYTGRGHRG